MLGDDLGCAAGSRRMQLRKLTSAVMRAGNLSLMERRSNPRGANT